MSRASEALSRALVQLFVITSAIISAAAGAKCALIPTSQRFTEAQSVVLVQIEGSRDGAVPSPYGLEGTLPGKLLTLRVLKVWKGDVRPGDAIYGWTLAPHIEHAYGPTKVGGRTIVFFAKNSAHEVLSCIAADPDPEGPVSRELDAIVAASSAAVSPDTWLERTRGR